MVTLVAAVVLAVAGIRPSTQHPSQRPAERLHELPEANADELREQWFFDQRAYPSGEVAPGARRAAFESMRIVRASAASPQTYRWSPIGPRPAKARWLNWNAENGRITAVAISPADSKIVLIGGSSAGIWRTADGGQSFTAVTDDQADLAVGSIAFAPSNPSVVYAGMGGDFLGTGVLRSDDAGRTWRLVTNSSFPGRSATLRLLVDPRDSNTVYLAQSSQLVNGTLYSSGLIKSTDGGVSWRTMFSGILTDLAMSPADPSTLLIGVSRVDAPSAGSPGLFRSTDGGRTWISVYTGDFDAARLPRYKVAIAASAPQTAYAYASGKVTGTGTNSWRLLASNDGGATWQEQTSTGLPQETVYFLVTLPSSPQSLYLGARDIVSSTDGGASWTSVTKGVGPNGAFAPAGSTTHVDQHAIAFDPASPSTMWVGNDGGLWRSSDGGASFTNFADRFSAIQFYSVNAHPTDPSLLFGGTQDNGVESLTGAGPWSEILTGDYGAQVFSATDPSKFLTNYTYGSILRFLGNGTSFDGTLTSNTDFGEALSGPRIGFIAPLAAGSDGIAWFGTWKLFTSTDFGTTWSAPGGDRDMTKGGSDVLSTIAVAATDPKTIYTGSAQGRVMLTRDGGVTATDITGALPNRFVKSIAVDRTSPSTAYVAFSGYNANHVYRTTNAGASWINASSGLPDIPVNALYIDRSNGSRIYAGTDIGVFRSEDGGNSWSAFNNGLPPVLVLSFTTMADGRFIAGTYGRGAYELITSTPTRRRSVQH